MTVSQNVICVSYRIVFSRICMKTVDHHRTHRWTGVAKRCHETPHRPMAVLWCVIRWSAVFRHTVFLRYICHVLIFTIHHHCFYFSGCHEAPRRTPLARHRNTCLCFNWISRKRWICLMGRTDKGAKRPVTRHSRLLVVRCARCGVSSHRISCNSTHMKRCL